ncbi:hypothetical protein [Ancylobacter lacus]|uniref:hypothetical protein n=1 Tax=Ancylobacter lacus TaxID=2579970 RepID=UPI001BCB4560|nr:hypothetical protein [Ancylobacter lacus]MBS7539090.1 hypothetical protein [Ancylobacter lacus]
MRRAARPFFRPPGRSAIPDRPIDVASYQASAQAALMMIESLTLALIDHRVLSREAVVDAVEMVIEAKRGLNEEGENSEIAEKAIGLLSTLANSLAAASFRQHDLDDSGGAAN